MHWLAIAVLLFFLIALLLIALGYLVNVLLITAPAVVAALLLIPAVTLLGKWWRLRQVLRSDRLADYVRLRLDGSGRRLSITSSAGLEDRANRDRSVHLAAVALTCLGILAIPYLLYANGHYEAVKIADTRAGEGVSFFFGYAFTIAALAYSLRATRQSRDAPLHQEEIGNILTRLNGFLSEASQVSAELDASIQASAKELGMAAPPAAWAALPGFVESHGPRTLSEPSSLRRFVEKLDQGAREVDGRLKRILVKREEVASLLRKTAVAVNRRGVAAYSLELEEHDLALRSDNLVELLEAGRWSDAEAFLEILGADLVRLEGAARALEKPAEETGSHHVSDAAMDEDEARRILQVPPGAGPEDIKSVYRMLARLWHPDRRMAADAEGFRKIQQAYELLTSSRG